MEIAGHMVIGFLASLLGSMVGIGGGIIIVPALTILMHVEIKEAIGSSLVSIVAMSSMASAAYAKKGWVHFKLGYILVVSTLVGSALGSHLAVRADSNLLGLVFGLFLLIPAVMMLRRTEVKESGGELTNMEATHGFHSDFVEIPGEPAITFAVRRIKTQIAILTASGLFSGLLGIGGGMLNVPVINRIGGVPFKMAAATSTLIMGLTCLMAVVVFLGSGRINPSLSSDVVIGALAGAYLGPKLAGHIRVEWLIRILVVLMLASSARFIYRAWETGL